MSLQIRDVTMEDIQKMIQEHQELNPDRPVRPDIIEALDNYANYGWRPGGFLSAVLENNLFEALGRADSYNRATIYQITEYIYNHLPSTCWGSPEKVESYLKEFEDKP